MLTDNMYIRTLVPCCKCYGEVERLVGICLFYLNISRIQIGIQFSKPAVINRGKNFKFLICLAKA